MRELSTVRKINAACEENVMGRGRQVFADVGEVDGSASRWRIMRARTRDGALEGRIVATGTWIRIQRAYTD